MPEVGKEPRTELRVVVRGKKRTERIVALLRQHGIEPEIVGDDDDKLVDVRETDWYQRTKAARTPGSVVNSMRWKHQLTQAELARRIGVNRQNISAIERGKRGLGLKLALKIAAVMEEPVERFFPQGILEQGQENETI